MLAASERSDATMRATRPACRLGDSARASAATRPACRLGDSARASAATRATRTERAGGAARERACRGVRGAKPLGSLRAALHLLPLGHVVVDVLLRPDIDTR